MAMHKVTFGEGLPGFEIGDKTAPALLVIQGAPQRAADFGDLM